MIDTHLRLKISLLASNSYGNCSVKILILFTSALISLSWMILFFLFAAFRPINIGYF